MATVKLILQQAYLKREDKEKERKLNPKETRLYAFLIIDRSHVIKIKTEYKIIPRQWDFDTQGKKDNIAGSIEFNRDLAELKNDIYEKYKETIKRIPDISFSELTKVLQKYGKTKEVPAFMLNDKGFFEVLDLYMKYLEGEVSPLTIKKFTSLKNSLKDFGMENRKYETLTFSMIDHKFLDDYRRYLRTQKPRGRQKTRPEEHQKGLLLNTQAKYIECLKGFCKWSEERGYNKYVIYKDFTSYTAANQKRKKSDREIVTLTLQELRQFYSHVFNDKQKHLERVRDLFCFGCFTGQRWGDFSNFSKNQLDGDVWTFIADKTKKETQIDLTGFAAPAIDILKKYDYKLPVIKSQKFNEYLKDAAEVAGINAETTIMRSIGANEFPITKPKHRFMSSHAARRTCVSILLNDYNLSIVHVMGITQHSDMKTLQKYVKQDREARREAVSKTKRIDEPLTVIKQAAV